MMPGDPSAYSGQNDMPSAPPSKARAALLKRLADVVSLPESRVNAFERSVAGDLLVEMLCEADLSERERVSRRLSLLREVPHALVHFLLRDDPRIAHWLIEECVALTDADLRSAARDAHMPHRRLIAARRGIGAVVSEALVSFGEAEVLEALLKNDTATLSYEALDDVVAETRERPFLVPLILRRHELRPAQAYVMFWWADESARRTILTRFSVTREALQEAAADVFPMAAQENWQDALSRKALQFIERRQRNRAAIDKSPYDSLEHAIETAYNQGMSRELVEEISYLAGIKPTTGAKIITDFGGEPLAILCKATGLKPPYVRAMWRALGRRDMDETGQDTVEYVRVRSTYELMAVDRAQTVLRYWNWTLSSALTPTMVQAIREGDESQLDRYSAPQKAAWLALSTVIKG